MAKDLTPSRENKIPYQRPQVPYMAADLILPDALNVSAEDDNLWVPVTESLSFKPLLLNTSAGYYINLLRVQKSGVLSRHRHSGEVHAFVIKGKWFYLEHDWVAEEASFVYEPPGETHTLYVPEDVTEMITLFTVRGGYTYVDPQGNATGYEDVFTKLASTREHYLRMGIPLSRLEHIIR